MPQYAYGTLVQEWMHQSHVQCESGFSWLQLDAWRIADRAGIYAPESDD